MKFVVRIRCERCDVETDTTATVCVRDDSTYGGPRLDVKPDMPSGWISARKYFWSNGNHPVECPECAELEELTKDTPD